MTDEFDFGEAEQDLNAPAMPVSGQTRLVGGPLDGEIITVPADFPAAFRGIGYQPPVDRPSTVLPPENMSDYVHMYEYTLELVNGERRYVYSGEITA